MVSQGAVCPHDAGTDNNETRLLCLLHDALNLVDSEGLPAEIGARLQDVIELVESNADQGGFRHLKKGPPEN